MVNIDNLYKKLDSFSDLTQGWFDGDLGDVIVDETIILVKELLNYIEAIYLLEIKDENKDEDIDPIAINLDITVFGDIELLLFNQSFELQILIKFDRIRSYSSLKGGKIDFKIYNNINELKTYLENYILEYNTSKLEFSIKKENLDLDEDLDEDLEKK